MRKPFPGVALINRLREVMDALKEAKGYRKHEDAALLRAMEEKGPEGRKEVPKEDINVLLAQHGLRI